MTTIPFITVEGPIGVGKTALATILSKHFGYHLLQEIVDENPFLDKFYENIDEWSFQTEMFFLCNRYKQLRDLKQHVLAQNKGVVADYHIFKNLLFAKRTLEMEEYRKYLQIYEILTADLPSPNLIVYLYASLDTLQERIALRGREFEKDMNPHYLEQLSADYETFFTNFSKKEPAVPVVRFNGDELDFVQNKCDLQKVIASIEAALDKRST